MHADLHPGARHDPLGNRVPQPDVEEISRADVAHRGEAGFDRAPGVDGREDRLLRHLAPHAVDKSLIEVVRPFMRQVGVGVDEPRAERRISQIDHL